MRVLWIMLAIVISTAQGQGLVSGASPGIGGKYRGEDASFTCVSGNPPEKVEWLLNGTVRNIFAISNVSAKSLYLGRQYLGEQVTFESLPLEFRTTTVQCRLHYNMSGIVESSDIYHLVVQDVPPAITSLAATPQNQSVLLSWVATSTPVANPVVTYCVNIVNSSSSESLLSMCEINETQFIYHDPPNSECHAIIFTVSSVNIVGELENTRVSYTEAETAPNLVELDRSGHIVMSVPVCSSTLEFTDVETGKVIVLNGSISSTNITFTREELRENRNYSVSITAVNAAGQVTSKTTLSTFDVKNVTVITESTLQTDYFEDSSASGALFIFVPLNALGTADIMRTKYLALDRNASLDFTIPFNLHAGKIVAFSYDIESDGTVASGVGYPAISTELNVADGSNSELPPKSQNCFAITLMSNVVVKCEYLDPDVTGFQVIVHQREEIRKLYINKTGENQTEASVLVDEPGLYQVITFAIKGELGIVNSDMEFVDLLRVEPSTTTLSGTMMDTTTGNVIFKPNSGSLQMTIGVSIGVVAGFLLLVVITLFIVILAFTYRRRKCRSYPVADKECRYESTSFGGPTSPDVKDTGPRYVSIRPEQISPPIRSNGVGKVSQELTAQRESQQPSPHPSPSVARQRHFEESQESAPSRNEIDSTYAVITSNVEPMDEAEVETRGESSVVCVSTKLYDEIRNPECAAEVPALGHDTAMPDEQVQSASHSQQPSGDAIAEMYAVIDFSKKKRKVAHQTHHENGASPPPENAIDLETGE